MADAGSSYDDIPYPSQAFAETHPDRLATLATLFGLTPTPVERCRVLELGCGDGANLIPMAASLPAATFVGIDLAARAIMAGQAAAAALGLTNLRLTQLDLMDLAADWGAFDYIIAHGLYAWVPEPVQARILEICGRRLTSTGVAYISYAAYPGWHMFGAIRDLLLYATRAMEEPRARARAALTLLGHLAEDVPDPRSPPGTMLNFYAGVLKRRMDDLGAVSADYILHDTLAAVHRPAYLHQFVERAAAHGLHYLTDADLDITQLGELPPTLQAAIQGLGQTVVEREQYLDFFRGRSFHKTLLSRQPAQFDRSALSARLAGLSVSSPATPAMLGTPAVDPAGERFQIDDGTAAITLAAPVSRAAWHSLAECWPAAVTFPALLTAARTRAGHLAGADPADDATRLADDLWRAFCLSPRLVGLHHQPPRPATRATDRPLASPVARLAAQRGPTVTNLYHQDVTLDGFGHCLLGLLDGNRDRAALLDDLTSLAVSDRLSLHQRGAPVTESAEVIGLLRQWLEPSLAHLARAALLVR